MIYMRLDTDNCDRLADKNIVRQIILNKQTPHDSLGITLAFYKHNQFDLYAIFIQEIQPKSHAAL